MLAYNLRHRRHTTCLQTTLAALKAMALGNVCGQMQLGWLILLLPTTHPSCWLPHMSSEKGGSSYGATSPAHRSCWH